MTLINGVKVTHKAGGTTADPILHAGPDLGPGDIVYTREGKKQAIKVGELSRFVITIAHGSESFAVVFDRCHPPSHDNPHLTKPNLSAATLHIAAVLAAEAGTVDPPDAPDEIGTPAEDDDGISF